MHRISVTSLNNRAFITLLSVVIAILGAMAMVSMRQELVPSMELPQVQVMTTSPGSSSQQVNDRISDPIENAVRGLENVEGTRSTSQSGLSIVTVDLKYGTDVSRSSNQIEAALNRIDGELPDEADPQVVTGGTGEIPAVVLSISSSLSPSELGERLDSQVVPEIQRIDGVSQVMLAGTPERIVRITPNQEALEERGLSDDAIATALDENGLSVPGGTVTNDGTTLDVSIGQPLTSLDDLRSMVLMPPESDQPADPMQGPPPVTTLDDVADVEEVDREATSVSRTNGRESLVMAVTATADGNVVDISESVEKTLNDLLPGVGGEAKKEVVFDQAPFIEESIVALAEEGLLGLVFAIGVILLFLRAVRPTIVTAISIPLSLLMAFLGMQISGYTLNMLTLAALTISIGRVVDDSIVVIENITRHLTYGKSRHRAILDAVGEVAGAITASTLATVIVFLPVAIVSGMAGELFRPFALTVAIAMLASLFVALTIVPVLAYWFLRPPKAARNLDPNDAAAVAAVHQDAEARESRTILNRLYRPTLQWVLKHRLITLALSVLVMVGTVAMWPLMKVNFLGDTGQNIAVYQQTFEEGTDLDQTSAKAADAEDALLKIDGVEVVQTTIGVSEMGFGGGTNAVTYQITTDPDVDQEELRQQLLETLQDQPEPGEVEDLAGGGALGSQTVDVRVTAPTPEDRQAAVDAIMAQLDPVPDGVKEVSSDLEGEKPTAVITVDREKAAQRGLTEEAVVGLIAREMYPGSIGTITLGDSELDIYVERGERPETLEELRNLEIMGMPVTDVATIEETMERPTIRTRDAQETATVMVTPEGDDVGGTWEAVQKAVDDADLPDGAEANIGGAAEEIDDAFTQLFLAMAAAILLTYVLLVWIFKSLMQPLVLLVSIPFAATGSFGLLILTQVPLGLPSMIGLLMLIGIVVTNAIVLIDLVNQYRRQGMGLDEAILTGAQKRLRPILMTSAATIFALVPMAFGLTGDGGFIAQPLAVVVIGGLITSTLLTLVIVPVLYRMTEGPGERRRLRDNGTAPAEGAADRSGEDVPGGEQSLSHEQPSGNTHRADTPADSGPSPDVEAGSTTAAAEDATPQGGVEGAPGEERGEGHSGGSSAAPTQ